MTSLGVQFGETLADLPLRQGFLKWQCRVRQNAMRDNAGRPDDGILPAVHLPGMDRPFGHIVTLINKRPGHSVTPELAHMLARTHDPAERREQAVRFLAASYYQKPAEFSDILTATFPPGSPGAARLRQAGEVRLVFDAFSQVFDLSCRVWKLVPRNPLHRATIVHNSLFNSALPPDTMVLGFEPDWVQSSSDPELL